MNRLLVPTAALKEEAPQLAKDALNHMKVWRLKEGEEVELFDGCGTTRLYGYCAAEKGLRAKSAARTFKKSARDILLFACITKGSRWDWTLEKATELGVTHIYPVISERTIVRLKSTEYAAKVKRWQRIVQDAARQSGAVWLPQVLPPRAFPETLPLMESVHCFVGALLKDKPPTPLLTAALDTLNKDVAKTPPLALFVGPEGDFTPEELAQLVEKGIPVSLGPTILRAETAALYGLAVLSSLAYSSTVFSVRANQP